MVTRESCTVLIFILYSISAVQHNQMVLLEIALGIGAIIVLWNVLASFIWSVVMLFEPEWKKKMPGPKPSSLILGGLDFLRKNYEEPYKPLPDMATQYGPVFLLRAGLLATTSVVVVAEPKHAAPALHSDVKGVMYDPLRIKGEQNVFFTDGPYWHFSRKLMNPAFSSQAIKGMFPIMVDEAKIFVNYLNSLVDKDPSSPIDINNVLQQVTLDVIMKTAFGYKISAVGNNGSKDLYIIQESFEESSRRSRSPLRRMFNPWSKINDTFYRNYIKKLAAKCVEARKNNPEELKNRKDLLTLLINAQDEETGEKLKDDQIVQEAIIFMLAGHETTAHSMTWFMYHLTQHPEWQTKVQEEIDQLFGQRRYPEHEDMANMKVLTMVLNESMRMTPVAPTAAGRELKEDVTINGHFVPKGTAVWAPIYLFHHNPSLWDKPEEFNPERFDNQTNYPKFAPFTTGPRSCIGQVFAKDEMKSILSSFVRNFSWTLAPGVVVKPHLAITLKPKDGLPVILKRR